MSTAINQPLNVNEQSATWRRFEQTYKNTPPEKRPELLQWYMDNFKTIGARHSDIIAGQRKLS